MFAGALMCNLWVDLELRSRLHARSPDEDAPRQIERLGWLCASLDFA